MASLCLGGAEAHLQMHRRERVGTGQHSMAGIEDRLRNVESGEAGSHFPAPTTTPRTAEDIHGWQPRAMSPIGATAGEGVRFSYATTGFPQSS